MRIGLIGAGRIGSIHAQTLSAHAEVAETLIYDVDPASAVSLAHGRRARVCGDVDTLFDGTDGVIIASTTATHAPLLRKAADAKIPAFCEKPIALDVDDSRSVVDAIRRAGIPVQIGLQRRFDAGYRRVRDVVRNGDVGTVRLIRLVSHDHDAPSADYVAGSGGIFKDNLIHDFDIARFVTGEEVQEVHATGSVLVADYFGEYGDVDTAAVLLRFTSGALGLLSAVRHDPVGYDVRIEVSGSKNVVVAGYGDRTPVNSVEQPGGSDGQYRTWMDRFGEAYRLEMEAFVELVRAGQRSVAATPEDAHEALRIAAACGASLTENRPVKVVEVMA